MQVITMHIFAFYTDEITTSGGPMSIHGLPGMILGVTIPRMYTSWIAKKVEVIEVNNNLIEPPKKGKKRTEQELKKDVAEVSKHWGSWAQQAMWTRESHAGSRPPGDLRTARPVEGARRRRRSSVGHLGLPHRGGVGCNRPTTTGELERARRLLHRPNRLTGHNCRDATRAPGPASRVCQ